jgi:hypothetical protein
LADAEIGFFVVLQNIAFLSGAKERLFHFLSSAGRSKSRPKENSFYSDGFLY